MRSRGRCLICLVQVQYLVNVDRRGFLQIYRRAGPFFSGHARLVSYFIFLSFRALRKLQGS